MISYCVTVYNEIEEASRLLPLLKSVMRDSDELVVIQTFKSDHEKTTDYYAAIEKICKLYADKYNVFHFQNNFAALKNYMTSQASQSYIFNFDADETMDTTHIEILRQEIISMDIDLFYLPRINIVDGITEEDIKKWSWNINEKGWINWPDYQPRIYKNNKTIHWAGSVHEALTGFKSSAAIIDDGSIAILHKKNVDKQRMQNKFYNEIGLSDK